MVDTPIIRMLRLSAVAAGARRAPAAAFGLKLISAHHCSPPVRRTDPFAMHAASSASIPAPRPDSVQDLGIDNLTAADGLAVGRGRPGSLAGHIERLLRRVPIPLTTRRCVTCWAGWRQRKMIRPETPPRAGRDGRTAARLRQQKAYHQLQGLSEQQLQQATHWCGATGGGMVPEEEMAQYLARGANLSAAAASAPLAAAAVAAGPASPAYRAR